MEAITVSFSITSSTLLWLFMTPSYYSPVPPGRLAPVAVSWHLRLMMRARIQTSDDLMTAGEGEKIGNLIVIKPSVMFYNPFLTGLTSLDCTKQDWQFVFNYMLKSKSYLIVSPRQTVSSSREAFPCIPTSCVIKYRTLHICTYMDFI